jgi:predicted nucleic acid-binding Zn ribbon protein
MPPRQTVQCEVCGLTVRKKRLAQRYCSERCRNTATQRRKRTKSGDTMCGYREAVTGPSTAVQGDDYPLEYYEDGYPKIPVCLDRRRGPKPLAEAA